MNGRVYDPIVGRFLSPDNYVQDPLNPQSYNRFAYCMNNPLKYTDPSGQFWGFIAAAAILIFKNYMDGYEANHHEANPLKWNWSNANFSVGAGASESGGITTSAGVAWGSTPVIIGYSSSNGLCFGYSQDGESHLIYPSLQNGIKNAYSATANYLDDVQTQCKAIGKYIPSYVGNFENAPVFESAIFEDAGTTLPPLGIFVGSNTYENKDDSRNEMLLRHEYGHWIQAENEGIIPYYENYAYPSYKHYQESPNELTKDYMRNPPEQDANDRSYLYFKGSR